MTSIAHSLAETASVTGGSLAPRESLKAAGLTVTALIATAAGYYLGARLGAAMHYPSSLHSVLWPPNAIVLAALLLMPIRQWWLCLAAVLPAHLAITVPAGFPWLAILGLFVTNTSQGVLSAVLIRRLTRGRDTAEAYAITFITCGVFVSPILFSFADVSILMQTGLADDFWRAWRLRFLSNAASTIIFVPPILAAARAWQAWRRPALRRLVEGLLLAAGFVLLGAIVMFAKPLLSSLLPLMLCSFLPLMLWAAVRFGRGGASCVMLGLVVVTVNSLSHWPVDAGGLNGLLMLQAFFLLVAIPVLFLGALHADLQRSGRTLDSTMKRYRIATAAGGIGVWDWDLRTGALNLDPELKHLLGYADHQIDNRVGAWMERMHPEDRGRLLRTARAFVRGKLPTFEDEHRMLHADGSTRWFLSRGVLVRGEAGATIGMIGTCIDVTERRRIADELSSLEVLSGAVLASLNEHVAIVDRAGRILAVNDAWVRFAGESATLGPASISQDNDYLAVYHCVMGHSDVTAAKAGIAGVLDGSRETFRMEYACLCADPMRWFEMSVTPLRRAAGGAVISHEDITRRKQAEIESEQHRRELTHLTRVRILGELSGAMAHELHQPLTAILSNAQAVKRLLRQEPLDLPELHVALDDIVAADKRASDVISRLRVLLKKGEAQFRPLDLNAVVNEVLELAHSDLVMRGVTTVLQLAPNLPPMRGDRVQLQQVVLNLIANACEAMTDGESDRRELRITTALGDDRTLQICVADNGSGIAQDMQERLFEPFVTTKKEGLGLGLPICQSIITAHGGNMRAVNNLEAGASLVVTLPRHPEGQLQRQE
jgi:PAS domain S-box-containing protein